MKKLEHRVKGAFINVFQNVFSQEFILKILNDSDFNKVFFALRRFRIPKDFCETVVNVIERFNAIRKSRDFAEFFINDIKLVALHVLEQNQYDANHLIALIANELNRTDTHSLWVFAELLSKIGANTETALPLLEKLLHKLPMQDTYYRKQIEDAICKIKAKQRIKQFIQRSK